MSGGRSVPGLRARPIASLIASSAIWSRTRNLSARSASESSDQPSPKSSPGGLGSFFVDLVRSMVLCLPPFLTSHNACTTGVAMARGFAPRSRWAQGPGRRSIPERRSTLTRSTTRPGRVRRLRSAKRSAHRSSPLHRRLLERHNRQLEPILLGNRAPPFDRAKRPGNLGQVGPDSLLDRSPLATAACAADGRPMSEAFPSRPQEVSELFTTVGERCAEYSFTLTGTPVIRRPGGGGVTTRGCGW